MKSELQAANAKVQAALDATQTAVDEQKALIDAMPADPVVTPDPVPGPPPSPPPPSPPPPPSQSGYRVPALPAAPVGPFADHEPFTVKTKQVVLNKQRFHDDYISIHHSDKALMMELLQLSDCIGDNVGSIFYMDSMTHLAKAVIDRAACPNVKRGRPFLRFCGVVGDVLINDVAGIYDPTPNTNTGDIATVAGFGNKAAGEVIKRVEINRVHGENIYCGPNPNDATKGWQPGQYWNGDVVTAERTVEQFIVNELYGKHITDGAVDSKARFNQLGLIYAEAMRCALKLWDDSEVEEVVSINPVLQGGIGGLSHLRLMGDAASGRRSNASTLPPVHSMPKVWSDGKAPLARIENGPIRFIGGGRFDELGGAPLLFKTNGGSLAPGSTWNGRAIS